MSASDDLLFLANRLKGVIDLIPTLQKVESLDNHKYELEKSVEQLTVSVSSLKDQITKQEEELVQLVHDEDFLKKEIKSQEGKLEALKKHISDLKSKF